MTAARTNGQIGKRKRYIGLRPLTEAQRALVEAHLEWACRGAAKHAARRRGTVSEDDLRSAAYFALCLAAQRFDPARGYAFKTFAMPWTESHMKRAFYRELLANGSMQPQGVPVPVLTRVEMPEHDPAISADLPTALDRARQREILLSSARGKRERAMLRAYLRGADLAEVRRVAGVLTQTTLLKRFRRIVGRARRMAAEKGRAA